MKQGVPQGSVLSPLLFYIDDLASAVGASQVNLFTDDFAVWMQDTDLERATSNLLKGLNAVPSWSTTLKMELSAPKPECSFFITNTHEARWRPALYLCRQQIKHNKSSLESHTIDSSPLVCMRPDASVVHASGS